MKIKLIRDARISHKAGEIVEVSPAEACFLVSVGSAIEIREDAPVEVKKPAPKKAAKRSSEVSDHGTESKE